MAGFLVPALCVGMQATLRSDQAIFVPNGYVNISKINLLP